MKQPPDLLDGAQVICYCSLGQPVQSTGQHHITIDGQQISPANVALCKYENYRTIYRFYCDENWEVLSDFDYLSIEEAIEAVDAHYNGTAQMLRNCERLVV